MKRAETGERVPTITGSVSLVADKSDATENYLEITMKMETLQSITLASAMVLSSACVAAPAKSDRVPGASDGTMYAYESDASGFHTKNFFYDNGSEVVVFDTQFTPELAQKSIDFIRMKTSNPITTVVITHPNPDKFNGISVFQRLGAKVIASRKTVDSMAGVHAYKKFFFVAMAKMFSEETYPQLASVDVVFNQTYDLRLQNGEVITLRELSQPGISSNQTIALVPGAHAVVVGDLVHHRAHAWLEGGIVDGKPSPSIQGWISDLAEIQRLTRDAPETLLYGGRGEVANAREAIEAQIAYLRKADQIVEQYIAKLGARKSELQGDRAGEHYQALQATFEKAFPSYGLGYLIQYGVYGLVNSKR
ncbi:MAG: hypothetical protein RJB38_184 [Pseudomonadota bacterium]|jgi:glyoxylase-like metal-dependent hydrolase (beta-lactamase superfamily II)